MTNTDFLVNQIIYDIERYLQNSICFEKQTDLQSKNKLVLYLFAMIII